MERINYAKLTMEERKRKVLLANGYERVDEIDLKTILHESEFLKVTVESLPNIELESDFLSYCTGIPESIFDRLKKVDGYLPDNRDILEIVKATIGIMAFAKMALDYYGIFYFYSLDGDVDSIKELGDGFYQFSVM
jgi:hypothetical protein